ncbi:MAG: sugar ABC transporter permease [Clostridia bacterium]|nr:sugar ABC transporter permease [Clostridia bacterium]
MLCFAVFALTYILPFFMTGAYSLQENRFTHRFVGLANYPKVWQNSWAQLALKNTLCVTLALVGCGALTSLLLGFLLHRHREWMAVGAVILLAPMFIPSASVATLWRAVFETNAFSPPARCYAALVSLFTWKYAGVGALLICIGLSEIPDRLIYAARLDGARSPRILFRVRLPLIRRQVALTLLFLLMYALRIYKESYLLFGEYPADCMYLIQHYMNNHFVKMNFQNIATAAMSLATASLLAYALLSPFARKGPRANSKSR